MSVDLPGASAQALARTKAIITTERQREGERERRRDGEKKRLSVPLSLCLSALLSLRLSISLSLRLSVSLSLCLSVSGAYFFFRFIKRLHQRLSDSAKWRRSSSTFASQDSLRISSLRAGLGPGTSSARSISRVNSSGPLAMRQCFKRTTSGAGVETTGRPAARYSRTFSGLELSVSSFMRNGLSATSKPLQ